MRWTISSVVQAIFPSTTSPDSTDDLTVLSASSGRVRLHVPNWTDGTQLTQQLVRLPGVRRVEANPITGNVLFLFDGQVTSPRALFQGARKLLRVRPPTPPPPPPPVEILSSSPGRLRVRLAGWTEDQVPGLEEPLRRLPGVSRVEANPLTGTVLLCFDPTQTNPDDLVDRLRALSLPTEGQVANPSHPRGAFGGGIGNPSHRKERSALISVRGLDRQPRLARLMIQSLQRKHGVRARLKGLTGHLVVSYDHQRVLLEELLATVAHLELPELPGEDKPSHPMDPEPLAEGLTRAIGTLLGMSVLTLRRLISGPGVGNNLAGTLAATLNLLAGFPFVRTTLRRLLGRYNSDIVSSCLAILCLTFADFPLGLIVSGVDALTLLSEVTARRAAWRRYEDRLDGTATAEPGAVVRIEAGMRVPHTGRIIEGMGSALGQSGLPMMVGPGALAPAGAILSGGPFVVELQMDRDFQPRPRPAPPATTPLERYLQIIDPIALAFAAFNGLRTGSLVRTFESLLLLNPRAAVMGRETANLNVAGRVLRGGLTLVGSRPDRALRRPDVLILDGPRLLTDGLEIAGVHPFGQPALPVDLLALAALVDAAAGSPWGKAFPQIEGKATSGHFNGLWATALVHGVDYMLGPPEDEPTIPDAFQEEHEGGYLLEVSTLDDGRSLGFVALRPRLAPGARELIATCRRLGVEVELLPAGSPREAGVVGKRLGLPMSAIAEPVRAVRDHQSVGALVAFVSDHAGAAEAFTACDLAVGMALGRGDFPARADVLAPDLRGVADLLEAGDRRETAVHDGITLSVLANVVGGVLAMRGPLGIEGATITVYLAGLAAVGTTWLRLRGGARSESTLTHLTDPRPERWGRRDVDDVLRTFTTTAQGLRSAEALERRVVLPTTSGNDQFLAALRNQIRAPITGILATGACLTLALGQPLNTTILGTTISLNLAAGVWQERQVGQAAEALQRMGAAIAHVLRDGTMLRIPATDVVTGDILVLSGGDRVAADARLIEASGLEVDEASLTGESLPVHKGPNENTDEKRIVLEGSDVVAGTARAVVVAVGRQTRLGATAAALNVDCDEDSPLGARLGQILKLALPVAAAGGFVAGLAGLIYGGAPMTMLTLGVSTALSAIPEGLPLLAGVGQAGVARRLAARKALVRRIGAVEALGRVDITCTDKTGTLTEGRLSLRLVADLEQQAVFPDPLPPELEQVLLTAALASPHLDAPNPSHQTTDLAVLRGAVGAGLHDRLRILRRHEVPFDSARAFYASLFDDRLCVKGAPERLLPRCFFVRTRAGVVPLDGPGRTALLNRVTALAERGLRVLMAAEGPPTADPDDPRRLTVLGFVGISDPLRPAVPEAVRRCLAAGVRLIMLTGDHPATARAIAAEAGLLIRGFDQVMRASDIADLPVDELGLRLEQVAVIARATPLDKLRIVEALRRRGHTVAMTGDGVNDAPSLRLADVGVAMGRSGTEVARQAADVVLVDDDFATLVESFVEGRGFWRNMRAGLGLLLGGNVGELAVIVTANVLGLGSPLTTAQILIVNMITDALPALAVLLQAPEHRNLAGLAREGLSALDTGLRRDVVRRGVATAIPTFAAYLFMHTTAGPIQGSAVAFSSVVATQLAQTLDAGRVEGMLSPSVAGAVGGSFALLISAVSIPPLRDFLGLLTPNPLGWGLVTGASVAAVAISRAISLLERPLDAALPQQEPERELPALPGVVG